jgi:hypothetical protein
MNFAAASSNYIQVPDNAAFTTHHGSSGKMTVIFPLTQETRSGKQTICGINDIGTSANNEFVFDIHENGYLRYFIFDDVSTSNHLRAEGPENSVVLGQAVHAAGVLDLTESGDDRIKVFNDGVRSSSVVTEQGTFDPSDETSRDILIGASFNTSPSLDRFFDGDIHDAIIFGVALSEAEIAETYEYYLQGRSAVEWAIDNGYDDDILWANPMATAYKGTTPSDTGIAAETASLEGEVALYQERFGWNNTERSFRFRGDSNRGRVSYTHDASHNITSSSTTFIASCWLYLDTLAANIMPFCKLRGASASQSWALIVTSAGLLEAFVDR